MVRDAGMMGSKTISSPLQFQSCQGVTAEVCRHIGFGAPKGSQLNLAQFGMMTTGKMQKGVTRYVWFNPKWPSMAPESGWGRLPTSPTLLPVLAREGAQPEHGMAAPQANWC